MQFNRKLSTVGYLEIHGHSNEWPEGLWELSYYYYY